MKKIFLALILFPLVLASCNESAKYPNIKTPLELQFFLAKQLDQPMHDFAVQFSALTMLQQNEVDIPLRITQRSQDSRYDFSIQLADALIKNNRKQEAVDVLSIKLETLQTSSAPKDVDISYEIFKLCDIARLFADAGDQEHALSTLEIIFQKAKSVPRDHVPTHLSYRIGKVMGKIGDVPKILEWNKKLGWNTTDGSTIDGAALALYKTKDLPTAMSLIQTSKGIAKFNALYTLFSVFMEENLKKEAEEILNEASKTAVNCKDDNRTFMDMMLVKSWLKLNRVDRVKEVIAVTWNDPSLNEKTRFSSLYWTRDLSEKGFKTDALQILNQALETLNKTKDKNPLYYYRLAIIANSMAFTDEKEKTISLIEEVWTKLPSQDKEQKEIHGELATAMAMAGNIPRSIEMLEKFDEKIRNNELPRIKRFIQKNDFAPFEEKFLIRDHLVESYCIGLSDEQIFALNKTIRGGNVQEILKHTSQFKENAWRMVFYAVNYLFRDKKFAVARDLVLASSMSDLEKLSLLRDSLDLTLKKFREDQKLEDKDFVNMNASEKLWAFETMQHGIQLMQKINVENKKLADMNYQAFLFSKCLFQIEKKSFSQEGLKIKNQLLDLITL